MTDLFGQDLPPEAAAARPLPPFASGVRGKSPTQRAAVARGLHPLGLPFREPFDTAATCGSCVNLRTYRHNGRWWKCSLRDSRCSATDISRRWPACVEWGQRDPGAPPA